MVGMVSTTSAPAPRVSAMNRSASEPSGSAAGFAMPEGMFMKNQSEPVLWVSSCHE